MSQRQTRVTNVDSHGIWVLAGGKEYFLPHAEFPSFRKATLDQIVNVELLHGRHLHWPELDVDLSLDSLENPGAYPLVAKE